MEIGQFRIRIRPDKLHHVLDQGSKIKPHEFHRCWIKRPQQETKEHVILLRVGDKNKPTMLFFLMVFAFTWMWESMQRPHNANSEVMVLTITLLPKKFKPPIIP